MKGEASYLAEAWSSKYCHLSATALQEYARQVIESYRQLPEYSEDKLNIPLDSILAEIIRPVNDPEAHPPLDPLALFHKYWKEKCAQHVQYLDSCRGFWNWRRRKCRSPEAGFCHLQNWALRRMKLKCAQLCGSSDWNKLMTNETGRVRRLSVGFFAAFAFVDALKEQNESTAFVNCFVSKILCRRHKVFVTARAFLNLVMERQLWNIALLKLDDDQIKDSLRLSGALGVAVSEGNVAIVQYLIDCMDDHVTRWTPMRIKVYEAVSTKKVTNCDLKKMARIILNESIHQPIDSIDEALSQSATSADDHIEIAYFGRVVRIHWTDVFIANRNGSNLFQRAIEMERESLVSNLISLAVWHQVDSDVLLGANADGRSPLHLAVRTGNERMVRLVLSLANLRGFDCHLLAPDSQGLTPLAYALVAYNDDILNLICKFCAENDIRVVTNDVDVADGDVVTSVSCNIRSINKCSMDAFGAELRRQVKEISSQLKKF